MNELLANYKLTNHTTIPILYNMNLTEQTVLYQLTRGGTKTDRTTVLKKNAGTALSDKKKSRRCNKIVRQFGNLNNTSY